MKNYWPDIHDIWWKCVAVVKEEPTIFWSESKQWGGYAKMFDFCYEIGGSLCLGLYSLTALLLWYIRQNRKLTVADLDLWPHCWMKSIKLYSKKQQHCIRALLVVNKTVLDNVSYNNRPVVSSENQPALCSLSRCLKYFPFPVEPLTHNPSELDS